MKNKNQKFNFLQRFQRALKLNIYRLFRSPGGARKVSLGFSIGFGIEMTVISTASLVYLLFIPIVRICKGSLPAAVIGNLACKATFLPVFFLPLGHAIGKVVYPFKVNGSGMHHHVHHSFNEIFSGNIGGILRDLLSTGLYTLIGMAIIGLVLGFISYFIVFHFYEKERVRRLQRRKKNQMNISVMRT
ncbi:DUF2062 domain-containing protein [Ectobacillus polymachus]|uniref:DUF2062 domain-containing protein n=1 Tax=Ectobacillus polymachus TaxID=1508806 RepID=UPI003A8BC347